MKKAVLLLTFNRLEYLKEVLNAVSKAKPPRLYIASDGPRPNKKGEKEKVEEVRQYLLDNITWECEVKTRFLETNSGGCGLGVSGAITWFFEHEEDGIILEDDCVPNQSFFNFCETLLDKYKDDKRIWHITGDAPIEVEAEESYYFAKIQHCWGWATWRDRWKHFSFDISSLSPQVIQNFSKDKTVQAYWQKIWNELNAGRIDTWDYQWTFIIVANNGLCINPTKNMVSNIGETGIHYTGKSVDLCKNTFELKNMIHPQEIKLNEKLVNRIYEEKFRINDEKQKFVKKFYLFHFIPIYKIKKKGSTSKHYLFGFIPFLKIKEK